MPRHRDLIMTELGIQALQIQPSSQSCEHLKAETLRQRRETNTCAEGASQPSTGSWKPSHISSSLKKPEMRSLKRWGQGHEEERESGSACSGARSTVWMWWTQESLPAQSNRGESARAWTDFLKNRDSDQH